MPGNHELWTHSRDPLRLRGEERYRHLVEVCRGLGVVTPEDPYPIWPGEDGPVVVVPLFVLYDYSFRPDGRGLGGRGAGAGLQRGRGEHGRAVAAPRPVPEPRGVVRGPPGQDRAPAGRAAGRPADGAGQPLPAGSGADGGDAVSGVRPVVRDGADGRLAGAVPGRGGRLRAPAHPADDVARRDPARGGVARLSARVEAPRRRAGHPAPDPARARRRTRRHRTCRHRTALAQDALAQDALAQDPPQAGRPPLSP